MAKSIRSIKSILDIVGSDRVFRLAVPVDGNEEIISKIGFGHELVEGVALVPAKIGKITSFNADGREIVRKDLPKERASIMFWGSSRDWHGNIHTSLRNRTVDRYPREWESAPEELLYLVSNGAVKYIVSRELDFSKDDSEAIMHIANLFLEVFDSYVVLDQNIAGFSNVKVRRLNWMILPEGEHPFENIARFVENVTSGFEENDKKVVGFRISTMLSHKPDFIAVGRGGFNGYVVLGYAKKGLYALESPIFGNATYMFKDDWEFVSKLTKKDIIHNALYEHRFVHNSKWRSDIRKILG